MPCADGELCHQPDKTPRAPHGHVCHGGCGGRLHGNCGSMVGDIETRRICCSCVARAGKRKETPAEGAGAGPSERPTKKKGGSVKGSCGTRARMDINGKLDILKLMDAKVSYAQIADRFNCSVRFLATVKADRKKIEAAAAAGAGSQKTARKAEFHEKSAPAYGELSLHFGVLESAADESGNGDAAFHLQKAKMAMIAAHAAKGVRQADMREFVET